MSESKIPRKHVIRWKYIIYPQFQLSLILLHVLLIVGIFSMVAFQVYRSFSDLKAAATAAQLPPNHAYFRMIDQHAQQVYDYVLIAFVVGLVVSIIANLLISHRIAGPFYRLRRYFIEMAHTGHFLPVSFRKGDFFSDLPAAINAALKKISQR